MILHSVLPSCNVKHLLLQFLLLFSVLAESVENKNKLFDICSEIHNLLRETTTTTTKCFKKRRKPQNNSFKVKNPEMTMAEVEEDEIDYEGMNNNLGQAFEAPPP